MGNTAETVHPQQKEQQSDSPKPNQKKEYIFCVSGSVSIYGQRLPRLMILTPKMWLWCSRIMAWNRRL